MDEQLTGRRHGSKRVIVRRERVKVEPKLCSADAVCLSDEREVVDVVFGRGWGYGGLAGELLFRSSSSSSGDHCGSSGGDDGVGWTTSPLWE